MAGTQFPGWVAGNTITATLLNDMNPITSWKTVVTSRASNVTATSDPDLILDLPSVGSYVIEAYILYTGAAVGLAGAIKAGLNYTGTLTSGNWIGHSHDTAATTNFRGIGATVNGGQMSFGTNGANFSGIFVNGFLTVSTTGQLQFQWAQNTTSATATVVRDGSWIRVQQVV